MILNIKVNFKIISNNNNQKNKKTKTIGATIRITNILISRKMTKMINTTK